MKKILLKILPLVRQYFAPTLSITGKELLKFFRHQLMIPMDL